MWYRKEETGVVLQPEASLKPDKDVTQFIQDVIDSLVMWELVVFLWNNPGITDHAKGIASRLGRRREDIQGALDALVKHGILEKWGASFPEYVTCIVRNFPASSIKISEKPIL